MLDNSLHLLDIPGDEHGMKKDKAQDGGMAWTVSNKIATMSHKTTTSGLGSMRKTSNDGRTVYEWLRHTHSARVFKFTHRNMRLVYHANEL